MLKQTTDIHIKPPSVLVSAWGPPSSEHTYRGVPRRLISELSNSARIVGELNLKQLRFVDILCGAVGWRSSIDAARPRKNPFWRYFPESVERLSHRYRVLVKQMPDHDVSLQFGVAGIVSRPLVAHVEMSLIQATASDVYARTYGFSGYSDRVVERALEGERRFLWQCDIVWTNSSWTAKGIEQQGVPLRKIRVCPPACGLDDPGPVDRNWGSQTILFVGVDWEGKGGPLLLEAFKLVREKLPEARLIVIGCSPPVQHPGVEALGRLDKANPSELAILQGAYRRATLFCMPTRFDTTGIVFFEAGMYGIPSIMLAGQGREDIFPPEMAIQLLESDPAQLAAVLTDTLCDPVRLAEMGRFARERVLAQHTWKATAKRVLKFLREARDAASDRRHLAETSARLALHETTLPY